MRAVRCRGESVELVDVPIPTGEGVRVRVRSAGICASDLHMVQGGWAPPNTLGHEIGGELDDGTPVAIEPIRPCETCDPCMRGHYNLCRLTGARTVIGVAYDGGMADELRVPARCIVPLPRGVEAADACLVEPMAVAAQGMWEARLDERQRVAIVGGGPIGLCAVATAGTIAAEVVLSARYDHQREAGDRLGAVELGDGGDYDVAVDAVGTSESLARCVELCRPGGTVLLLATYWSGAELPAILFTTKGLRMVASTCYAHQGIARSVDVSASLLALHPKISKTLISHRLPLDAAPEAFALAADRKSGVIKVVLEP